MLKKRQQHNRALFGVTGVAVRKIDRVVSFNRNVTGGASLHDAHVAIGRNRTNSLRHLENLSYSSPDEPCFQFQLLVQHE